MNQSVLLGLGHHMLPIPRMVWQDQVGRGARHGRASLGFMTEDHHRVRDLVVRELPRIAAPLSPELIAGMLSLPMDRLQVILDELERHMTFLFRNREGAVAWAYPVTADPTPHRVTFSTGERIYAA